jgi:hypothetical protein
MTAAGGIPAPKGELSLYYVGRAGLFAQGLP